jgi:hypothetical protein
MINRIRPEGLKKAARSLKKRYGMKLVTGTFGSNYKNRLVNGKKCNLPTEVCAISAVLLANTPAKKMDKVVNEIMHEDAMTAAKRVLRLNTKYMDSFITGFDSGDDFAEERYNTQIQKVGYKDGLAARKAMGLND